MRTIARRRPLAGAVAGLLLAAAATAAVQSSAQAALTDDTVGSLAGRILPGSWRFDTSVTTLAQARAATGSDIVERLGYTGKGVGVALVDTGVVPVPGLTSGNVVDGADLSFESQVPELAHLDTFGHGTHMAGIIVGNDPVRTASGASPRAPSSPASRWAPATGPPTSRRSSPPWTGWSSTATTTRATRSACSTCPTAPTASRTTRSTRSPTRWRTPGAPASSSWWPAATPASAARG